MKWLTPHFLPLGLVILSVWLNFYHQGKYQQKAKDYDDLNTKYQTQVIAIKDQQERIKHFAELDTKYIQELAHAKSKITQLSDDLRTNVKRVHVKAQCPVSETASPSGVDGSRPARLEKDAEQDYVRLLGELEILEAQYLGLRDYVQIECGGNDG